MNPPFLVAALPALPRPLLVALALALAFGWWQSRTPAVAVASSESGEPVVCRVPGLGPAATLALADAPLQIPATGATPFRLGSHRVVPRAGFAVDAKVLGAKRYRLGPESAVSPLDLALGWGPMARPEVSGALEISQSTRWYHFRSGPDGAPVPLQTIVANSSNLHMIPSSRRVAGQLLDIDEGERVRIVGWLVDVEFPNGGRWPTSLRRDDTGNGACEIVYVCEVAVSP